MPLDPAPGGAALSWRALCLWLFVVHAALAALVTREPQDFFWLDTPIMQLGIFAALALAVVTPALSLFRKLAPRLLALGQAPPGQAIAACLGLGLTARVGADLGRIAAQASPYDSAIDFMTIFPANALSTALVFLLSARLLALRAARKG